VHKYGSLESFSAFPFESALGKLKPLIKGRKHPLRELANHYQRKQIAQQPTSTSASHKCIGSAHSQHPKAVITNSGMRLSSLHPDCHVQLVSNDICIIKKIQIESTDISFLCDIFHICDLDDYFTIPCKSSVVGIFSRKKTQVPTLCNISVSISCIKRKYVCFQKNGFDILVPMLF
jgi:hypothetical protein